MNVHQIKKAIEDGERVYWSNLCYEVKQSHGEWNIVHEGGHIIGLTHMDEITLNGDEGAFFIWGEREVITDKLVMNDIVSIETAMEYADYSYLSNVLKGEGFTPYNAMAIHELNAEWQERFLNEL